MNLHILIVPVLLVASLVQDGGSPFTLDQIMSSPFPTELTVSPVGNRVAWVFDSKGRTKHMDCSGPNVRGSAIDSVSGG